MHTFHLLAALISGIIMLFSLLTKKIEHGPVSELLLAMLLGIVVGPVSLGWVKSIGVAGAVCYLPYCVRI